MKHTLRRVLATGAVAAIGLAGAVAPASAEDTTTPECDQAALSAAITTAKAEVRAAQKAYTTHTRTSMQTLLKKLKSAEIREARAADRKADQLEKRATKLARTKQSKEARAQARAARAEARKQAHEAARIRRANLSTLKALVKVERKQLKAAWDSAKRALRDLQEQAEDCAETETEPETGDDNGTDTGSGDDSGDDMGTPAP